MTNEKKFLVEVLYADESVERWEEFNQEQGKAIYEKQKERMQFDSEILSVELKEQL